MKKLITFIFSILIFSASFAQVALKNVDQEISPDIDRAWSSPIPESRALWDIQFNHNLQATLGTLGKAGAVYYPGTNSIWVSYWNTTVSNYILNISPTTGAKIDSFLITGVTGVRALTFDGTFIYAGSASTTISKIDPVTRTRVGTIPSPVNARYCAYDPIANGLWVGDFSSAVTLISMTGTTIRTIPYATLGVTSIYGCAFDDVSAGGPFLWLFAQGAGQGSPQMIQQINATTGLPTGVNHNVLTSVGVGNPNAIAGGLGIAKNLVSGMASLVGILQGTPDRLFAYELTSLGPPCPVGLPTNPSPANNALGVAITGLQLTWTNPATANSNELYFGTNPASLPLVQSGTSGTYNVPGTLNYSTNYYWFVKEKNDTCSVNGPVWSFKTMSDPNSPTVFLATFEDAVFPPDNWSLTVESGTAAQGWARFTTASGYGIGSAAARFNYFGTSAGNIHSMITESFAPVVLGSLKFDHAYAPYNATYDDKLDIDYSMDNGATWTNLVSYSGIAANPLATAPAQTASFVPTAAQWGTKNLPLPAGVNKLKFKATSGFGNCLWLDNIQLDNVVPVELTAFNAEVIGNSVTLNWITASELNNSGFEIERSSNGSSFEKIDFVNGNGTTTETRVYYFTDNELANATYSYRLKQVDYDGTFDYSSVVEVEVNVPGVYSLGQNYPNPFNPSTTINFALAGDSKVSLKIFDLLGQEVATIVNTTLATGSYTYNFDASHLNSGVYFYQLEAQGNDGSSFKSVKKMILTK
jgi:hypothetical protein